MRIPGAFLFLGLCLAWPLACNAETIAHTRISPPENCAAPFARLESGILDYVYDGDTLRLTDGRKIRLIGINTPELGRDGSASQPFARAARDAARRFFSSGNAISLLFDSERRDRHGRWLAHIYNSSGQSLEYHLLGQGLAYHVAVPPNVRLAECFAMAESTARQINLGLWSSAGIAPAKADTVRQGGYQRVQGTVTELSFGFPWKIELDGRVTALIYPEHQQHFSRKQLQNWLNQPIEIQGWLSQRRGQWQMRLETSYGIEQL